MIPHFELSGPEDAPVLVLGNSLGTTTRLWDGFGLPLRILRYDHRGHGGSAAPPGPYTLADLAGDVVELLDHLGLRRVEYCGVSLGGMVGMWLAAYTDRISRLALVCTTAWFEDKALWDKRILDVRAGGLERIADAVVGRWFTPHFDAMRVRSFHDMLLSTDPFAYAACCEAIRDMDLRPALPRITAPTAVIAAAQDHATPPEHLRAISEAIRDSSLYIVGDAAHLANVEAHSAVEVILDEHLGGGNGG
ncbi:3-oxoadipate enol-lactonase [Lentzea sp. NBRC 105346]|uniref:3-oxoadipate enol-lactonase n=1 Tax=Lentzea sp. NBRC 105346 TaxID=3032205 RepID=UPI0024A12769|nr:3-oxoadipate enol-lactonase [Lentzea sp. NBRC 105346]GLZ33671.1 3-oxoadipate enol-lactonase [Lentzea sp. NBRC 105346]